MQLSISKSAKAKGILGQLRLWSCRAGSFCLTSFTLYQQGAVTWEVASSLLPQQVLDGVRTAGSRAAPTGDSR